MAAPDSGAQDIITCDLCSSPVELYCNPCQTNLCAICSPKHMRSKLSKKHNVVLYRERMLESVFSECASHADQECTMFCKTCDCPICVKCVTTSHKKHDFIDIEQKILSSMKAVIEADTMELEGDIIPTYERIQFEIEGKKSDLHREYDEVQKNINRNGVTWHEEIDIVIQKQTTEAKQMKDRYLSARNKHQTEIQGILYLARDVVQRNKGLLAGNNDTEIKNYKSRNDELRTVPQQTIYSIPSFTSNLIPGEFLYRQFGKVQDAIESEIEFKIKQLTKPEVDIECTVRTKYFFGLSYLPVDKMWIHGAEDNIDLIDIQGTVLDTVKTLSGGKPIGLTVTTDGHLIYGDGTTCTVNIVKKGQTSTIMTLPDGWVPWSTCFTRSDDLLFLMYKMPDFTECKVVRYDKDYTVIQEIQYDDKGAPLYTAGDRCMYIAENKNTDICVSNIITNSVITVNQSGKLRWRYTGHQDSHSFDPQGIATDSQCHVLVASPKYKCVHVIDKDGQFLCFIDECGFKWPYVLFVDRDDRLFVGDSVKSNCTLKVIRYLD